VEAIRAAYRSGHVFLGRIDVPAIDVRHYLDPELDMHHSFASFSTRARVERVSGGPNDRYVIWMSEPPYDPTPRALELADRWLTTGHRPDAAEDGCWDENGRLIASGPGVWDGPWRGSPKTGACLSRFPAHESPRDVAGAPITGDLFKCARVTIDSAIASGLHQPIDMHPYRDALERVFPDGVCDYSQGDVGRPDELKASASR
jgi:hypothetical protein